MGSSVSQCLMTPQNASPFFEFSLLFDTCCVCSITNKGDCQFVAAKSIKAITYEITSGSTSSYWKCADPSPSCAGGQIRPQAVSGLIDGRKQWPDNSNWEAIFRERQLINSNAEHDGRTRASHLLVSLTLLLLPLQFKDRLVFWWIRRNLLPVRLHEPCYAATNGRLCTFVLIQRFVKSTEL